MDEKLSYHSDPAVNTQLKVLLVYSNTPMDNLMPVSVSTLSGALKQKGFHDIKLFDTTYYPLDKYGPGGAERKDSLAVAEFSYKEVGIKFQETNIFDDFRKLIEDFKPDLLGLSTVEPTHILGMDLLNSVKDLHIPTIVGGVYTTFSPEEVIKEESVDMICLGEGEQTIVEICEKMASNQDLTSIENIWIKQDGKTYKNPKSQLENMDDLPILDFSIFNEKRVYRPMAGKMYRMAPIEFSRGCMYKCTYCSAPMFEEYFENEGTWLRNRSLENIRKEMEFQIDNYNIEYFYFVSETFLGIPMQRIRDFCDMYADIGLPFWFNTRPETISEDRVKMLEDIGCHRMSIGIECGNELYRRNLLKRPVSNKKILEACDIVAKSSIQLSVNNVIGLPEETRNMIFDTISLNRKITADNYSCSVFQPYHGTHLYKHCVEKGIYPPEKICQTVSAPSPLVQGHITAQEIAGLQKTFQLYIKLPESEFDLIRKAEKSDEEGKRAYKDLSKIFHELASQKEASQIENPYKNGVKEVCSV